MFINEELDLCPAFGWSGGPTFNTRIIPTQNWMERRNANAIECRHTYRLPFQNILNEQYLLKLSNVFLATRGMLHSFKAKDPVDHSAVRELFMEGDGVKDEFQLYKVSQFGPASYVRTITKPQARSSRPSRPAPHHRVYANRT